MLPTVRVTYIILDTFEEKKVCLGLFINTEKAFDIVLHDGLLYKIKPHLPGTYFRLLQSYLSNMMYSVKIDDTGSTNTIINRGLANTLIKDRDLSPCGCFLMTLSGKKALLGEFLIDCRPINGKSSKMSAHVADIGSRRYDAIIGTDLFQQLGCNLIAHRGK